MRRAPFKGMRMKKSDRIREVSDVSLDYVWWFNPNTKKKAKIRQTTMKSWNEWVDGGPHGTRAVEVTGD